MRVAGVVYTGASVAVVRTLAMVSCCSVATAPVSGLFLLLRPGGVQILEVASVWIVVYLMVGLGVNFSDAESSRAKLNSFSCSGAASLSNVVETLSANLQVFDPKAVSVLPSVLDLVVAEPRLTVEGALLVFLVEERDIFPAGVVRLGRHDALMREIIEVG